MKSRFLLAIIAFTAAVPVCLAQTCFAPPVVLTTGNGPNHVVVGDFDNDGNPDFVLTYQGGCEAGAGADIFLGNGKGGFKQKVITQIDADPYDITSGDFNGDGILDLAAALGGCGGAGSKLEVALGNGDGSFQPQQVYDSGVEAAAITTGDFNGDGIEDMLVSNAYASDYYLWFGNGDGTFRLGLIKPLPGFASFQVVAADFNHDGKLDLANQDDYPPAVYIQLGNGDGTFGQPFAYNADGGPNLVLGDLNNDGNLDVVITTGNRLLILLGNGDGSQTLTAVYPEGHPSSAAIGDITGDGKPDLLVTASKGIYLRKGRGDGTFPNVRFTPSSLVPGSAQLADFNKDGLLDVVTTNPNDRQVSVFRNTGQCH